MRFVPIKIDTITLPVLVLLCLITKLTCDPYGNAWSIGGTFAFACAGTELFVETVVFPADPGIDVAEGAAEELV